MLATVSLFVLIAGIAASPAYQSMSLGPDGSYQFFYDTGKEAGSHSREEARGSDGVVVGKYSYQDPTGDVRVVNYRADDLGYVAKGDVSVPGAPPSQFPVEEPKEKSEPEEGGDDEQNDSEKASSEDDNEDSTPKSQEDNDEYEDDVKAMKIQEPSYDAPPDGFPVGFFDQSFQGLRRLPEPTTEQAETTEKKDSSEDGDSKADSKSETNPNQHINPPFFNAFFPFTHFEPPHAASDHAPHVPGAHHPVYVYSYQQPQAHGYYYVY